MNSGTYIENLPFTLGAGTGSVGKIGLVVLASDYTIEYEFRQVFDSAEIDFFTARIANSPTITPATLADMKTRIASTLELLLPGDTLDVVAYCCTSATVVLGEDTIFKELASVQAAAKLSTPVTAAFAAFNALSVKSLAVLTPYRRDVNKSIGDYFENTGYSIEVFGSFNEELDPRVARIDSSSLESAIEQLLDGHKVDGVFVSCTSIRMLDQIAGLEARFGVPITSSNQALGWHCLRLAGSDRQPSHLGSLFEHSLSDADTPG